MTMQGRYVVVVEGNDRDGLGFSAYAPDVPGVIATGNTVDECLVNMSEAMELHFEGLREDGLPIPEPTTSTVKVLSINAA
jgi:predicted RNase H-like HicB family nuclease